MGDNGGGAFVLMYVFLALVVGLSLLVGELVIGKSTRLSIWSAMDKIDTRSGRPFGKFVWVGRAAILVSIVVLSYYAVISGWVLHFLTQFVVGLVSNTDHGSKIQLDVLLNNGWLQMGLASVHLLLVLVVVLKGLQEGFEKWISYIMPAFAILLVILAYRSLSLPNAVEALRFLLYPDFSKLTLSSPIHALGHVLFTLSVGFGTMVTFGSYLRDNDHIPTAGFRVAFVDTALSLFAGLLIFPIVWQASNIPMTEPALLFETLPKFLISLPGGLFFGIVFFLFLYLAALGASIGLLEMIVSNFVDRRKMSRQIATWLAVACTLLLSTLPALSSSNFKGVRVNGKSLLEILDSVVINWALPLVALGISLAIIYGFSKQELEKNFVDSKRIESVSLFPYWVGTMKWVIPTTIVLAWVLQIIHLLS